MNLESFPSGVKMTLELLQDCAREAATVVSDDSLAAQVMDLFRAEDLDGLAQLMRKCRIEQEFATDLNAFILRWSAQDITAGIHPSRDFSGADAP